MPLRWSCGLLRRRRRWRQHSRQNYQNDAGVIACLVFYPSRARALFNSAAAKNVRPSHIARAPRRAFTYFHRNPNFENDNFNLEQFNCALVRIRSMGSLKSCIEIKMCDNSNKINHINSNEYRYTGFSFNFFFAIDATTWHSDRLTATSINLKYNLISLCWYCQSTRRKPVTHSVNHWTRSNNKHKHSIRYQSIACSKSETNDAN